MKRPLSLIDRLEVYSMSGLSVEHGPSELEMIVEVARTAEDIEEEFDAVLDLSDRVHALNKKLIAVSAFLAGAAIVGWLI